MEEEEPRPFGVLAASLWCIVSAIAMTVIVAIFETLRPGAASDLVTLTIARVFSVSAIVLAIARVHAPDEPISKLLGVGHVRPQFLLVAVVLGLALCVCLGFVDERLAAAFPLHDEGDHEVTDKLLAAPSEGRRAFLVLALMFVLPACHEILFRGAVFTGLVRVGKPSDAAITTVLLEILTVGLAGDVRALASTVGFAIAVTYVRFTSKSLVVSIATHVAFYASVLAVAWKPSWSERDIPRVWAAVAAMTALACVAALRTMSRDAGGVAPDAATRDVS